MPNYENTPPLGCNDCGVEIPVAAVAGPDGTVALTDVSDTVMAEHVPATHVTTAHPSNE